ncbi:glucose-6-phosphate 1-dehydrogenase, cytoplasmic isoform 2 [Tribonema minus]|uniref:glucose-6-phosphate dehydrogenase (NADP(+)) n=1 Tax=Tribonema minus TaxID=303371 RepID=A0A836CPA6_9STRA|nr:glucose-6-phosphate 1-dehydrogenase, cytoplasmic isoform 2 [Tribonema minus]
MPDLPVTGEATEEIARPSKRPKADPPAHDAEANSQQTKEDVGCVPTSEDCRYFDSALTTFPALYDLFEHGFLPSSVAIVGYARSNMTDEQLRDKLRPFVEKASSDKAALEKFFERVFYRSGGYDDHEAMKAMIKDVEKWEAESATGKANRIFYFAVPPSVFLPTAAAIKDVAMSPSGWSRLIVEKPFGHDLESAKKLTDDLGALYDENYLYRIDHYLGKEMVQNLLVMRFSNTLFEPLWSRDHIASVTFTFKEDFGTEGRGGYFDSNGIIRDVIQNHLMQVFALIAMAPPVKVSGPGYSHFIRDAKVEVLQCIAPIDLNEVVLGQYVAAKDGSKPGYLDDETVPKESVTPTFATVVLRVNNSLNKVLVVPDESTYLKTNIKAPGLRSRPIQSEMDLTYRNRYPSAYNPEAYTRLILEVLRGKQATFVRSDELLSSWEIFTPLLKAIDSGEMGRPIPYEYGSRGPPQSDELIERVGFKYNSNYRWSPTGNAKI